MAHHETVLLSEAVQLLFPPFRTHLDALHSLGGLQSHTHQQSLTPWAQGNVDREVAGCHFCPLCCIFLHKLSGLLPLPEGDQVHKELLAEMGSAETTD